MNATARTSIIDFLRRELVGPDPDPCHRQKNGEEILRGEPPRVRYGAGILFPQAVNADLALDGPDTEVPDNEDATDAGERDEADIPQDLRLEESTADNNDDAVALANSFLPSAMGLSFLVKLPDEGITVEVGCARYTAKDEPLQTADGTVRQQRSWLRIPLTQEIAVPAAELSGSSAVEHNITLQPEGDTGGLALNIVSRPVFSSADAALTDQRMLTVSLVNMRCSNAGRTDNEQCYFQVSLRVTPAGAGGAILEYPESAKYQDEEERSLTLLYRHRKTFAIGHGCAANWKEDGERAASVWADVLPVHEVKPIVPTRFEDLRLGMLDLSDHPVGSGGLALLEQLCGRYAEWIDEQESEVSEISDEFRKAAERHLASCRLCLDRMRDGVELLKSDKMVLGAFRLANRAMLMQQLHYSLPLREWYAGEGGLLSIEQVIWPELDRAAPGKGSWYPFQLAFILMNLRSLAEPAHRDRQLVDMIWFPTGGGKTEAYLGLAAFAIILRRQRNPDDAGTAVLMRYTLRLLTAQQFQRAASLICALELMRRDEAVIPGDAPITIGLWAGGDLTPNKRDDAVKELNRMAEGSTQDNPFVILQCPWCGAQMGTVALGGKKVRVVGYRRDGTPRTVQYQCPDDSCQFGGMNRIPATVIDEDMYERPPALLIGTVDKFALLPWQPDAGALFGRGKVLNAPPELVIQDELHLISGPLGSMVGHYETLIQHLCSRTDGETPTRPKIIASTATISRASEQCRALYNCGRDDVVLFPPQALRAGDSFFAHEDDNAAGRVYVGVHASALPSHVTAQVRVMSALLQAPQMLDVNDESERDPYWTLVGYFNSLRELGHAATLVRADIREYLNAMWLRKDIRKPAEGVRDRRRFINSFIELTSRISSGEIPRELQRLTYNYPQTGDEAPVDVCFATNMISVGVDVPRLGLMTVVGQPKTTSEYIQATSRVGRRHPGLVVVVYNTAKPRDRSHYEHFHSYHDSIYRQVEPTSVTPFVIPVRERALHAVLVGFVRHLGTDENRMCPAPFPTEDLLDKMERFFRERVSGVDTDEASGTLELLAERLRHWRNVLPPRYGGFGPPKEEVPLMYPAGTEPLEQWESKSWPTPSSMRDVDATCEARVLMRYPRTSHEQD